ncbi:Uncharacterized protein SCG7109_AE_00050 [Chlamydiales bacterium SCGC AG-110-M15]|nr:Uncharacterized protein SCG7109_AE_00050 [Chlamydiales bacterium SCGC AG-110-M15]
MLSFRQKILISNICAAFLFLTLMFPLASKTVKGIMVKALEDRADELIHKVEGASDIRDMILRLKKEKPQLFFRVSILDQNGGILYDTHAKRLLGAQFTPGYIAHHHEVEMALRKGVGYAEDYSTLLQQQLTYVAKRFTHNGKYFVVRTAFPYKHVEAITESVKISFLLMGVLIVLLFSLMTWLVIQHFTQPIQQIINVVKSYKEGEVLPNIHLEGLSSRDEFSRLAQTLNSLSLRVRNQFQVLTSERNEKHAILESLNEGVIAVDEQLNITYINDIASQMLNVNVETALEKNFESLNHPDFYDLLSVCLREQQLCTSTAILGDNPTIYLELIAIPKGKGGILVLQDTSSHYRMMEMRKDFIANASHELKTPVTIIQGFAETLHDNPDLPKETTQPILERIMNTCLRMTKIIKNLLTLADIENLPQSRLQNFDLLELVHRCRENVLSARPEAEIIVDIKTSHSEILADPDLLEVAINNLMDNAVKYSSPPAHVTVIIDKRDKDIILQIIDQGVGIPQHELENVFIRFYKFGKSQIKGMSSSGLGLSIVKTIIDKHFGTITVESKEGVGSTFTIVLPVREELF